MIAPEDREPLDQETVDTLLGALGAFQVMVLGLGAIDKSYGQARLGPVEKCVWLSDARRVTIELVPGGGYCAGVSNDPDPEAVRG